MFSRICRSDDAKTVWRVLLICVNSLQVINIEILPTLPINHLIKLSCATILQWFWDFTAVVPLFRKKTLLISLGCTLAEQMHKRKVGTLSVWSVGYRYFIISSHHWSIQRAIKPVQVFVLWGDFFCWCFFLGLFTLGRYFTLKDANRYKK